MDARKQVALNLGEMTLTIIELQEALQHRDARIVELERQLKAKEPEDTSNKGVYESDWCR